MEQAIAALSFAERSGYSYSEWDDGVIANLPLAFLHSGGTNTIEDVITGDSDGMSFSAFLYTSDTAAFTSQYPFGSAGAMWQESVSTCLLTRIDADLPETAISRETVGHWLTHLVRHDRVEFDDGHFSRHIRVTSVDPEAIRSVLDEAARKWLLEIRFDFNRDICYELSGPHVLLFTKWLPPDTIPKLLPILREFSQLLSRP